MTETGQCCVELIALVGSHTGAERVRKVSAIIGEEVATVVAAGDKHSQADAPTFPLRRER